ncbi:MAG TPA: VWA domain-containing protein, partial [Dongiaceae bacterium]
MIQAQMFQAVGQMGGLDLQLAYYRGFHEFEAFPWLDNAAALTQRMTGVFCLGGHTQIARVLKHAIAETKTKRVNALVFVGDCMEEPADNLCHMAGQLGVLGLPIFLFHEGREPLAAATFQQLARLSSGAYCPFDAGSAHQLTELLRAVAVYAAGGLKALQDYSRNAGGKTLLLTRQLGAK